MLKPIARMLAEKLIEIYVDGKLPHYAKLNVASPEGFTEERIQNDPQNSLLQMILLSAYDRQPFTRWAGGFEQIAGLNPSKESLPDILRSAQLFTVAGILCLKEDTIDRILVGCSFYGHHLASYSNVQYARTFKEAAEKVASLLSDIRGARTASDIGALHRKLQSIHGIGTTIASKLIMYTFRESPYFGSSIHPRELYPAVKPIMGEYHVGNIARVLKERYGQTIIDDILEQLKELGDPFAIDALFYIDREAPKLLEYLLNAVPNQADDKERGMSTDNKEALETLTVHLPRPTKKLLEREAQEQFGLDASTLAQVWIIDKLRRQCPPHDWLRGHTPSPQTRPVATIAEKIRSVVENNWNYGQSFSPTQLINEVRKNYPEVKKTEIIAADLAINKLSGYNKKKDGTWAKKYPFLFARNDGKYERYDPARHGSFRCVDDGKGYKKII
jgi:hypothetical protein